MIRIQCNMQNNAIYEYPRDFGMVSAERDASRHQSLFVQCLGCWQLALFVLNFRHASKDQRLRKSEHQPQDHQNFLVDLSDKKHCRRSLLAADVY